MAHLWNIIDGDIYVSKNGDDVAGDGSMANPYASLEKGYTSAIAGNKIIVGSGLWQEAVSIKIDVHLLGDGEVIFDGSDPANYFKMYCFWNESANWEFSNIKFLNYYSVQGIGGDFATGASTLKITNCEFSGAFAISISRYGSVLFTIFSSIIRDIHALNFTYIYNSTLINISSYVQLSLLNCILINCRVDLLYSIAFCNFIDCDFYYNSVYLGSFQDALNHSFGIKLNTSISLDPKFNNSETGDFTLKPDSPCLFAGKNNATIGALGLGYSFNANSSEFTKEGGALFSQTTLVDDIVRTQQTISGITRFLFQMNAGHASGNVESAWIDLQAIRYLLITRIFANLIYNASGMATSRPDNLEAAGEKAVYHDFELKYCNEESEKAAATFKNAIWNKAVTIDNSDRGNADPAFVASEAKYISARFVKIKLYMTEA